ncbi:hypothetical protein PQX77_021204 [Marasmius sp. AFHP31]|nr:hypothetical protein PQX77_021204 [Marasmius sp. AFHP31]
MPHVGNVVGHSVNGKSLTYTGGMKDTPVISFPSPPSLMLSHFFQGARKTKIGRKSVFQHVEGNVNHNYFNGTTSQECEEDRVMPTQNRYREILEGDVFYREQTYSEEMEIVLRGASATENGAGTRIKIVKTFHTGTIYPNNNCPVTVVTFEPEEDEDKNVTRLLWEELYRSFSVCRSPWLAQMLGLVRSEIPTFILHEELVNGLEFTSRYPEDGIVYHYLYYTHEVAMQALRADQTSTFPVSRWWADWTFNPKTKSWHFDIASALIGEWEDDFSLYPIPLPQGSQPQLTADDITTYFEKAFEDVLYLYASWGCTNTGNLSYYASHGVLTFGAVIQWGGEIVAHFPFTPSPELYFESQGRNITAIYSTEVSSRVDMQIHNVQNARLTLYFSLRLPLNERNRLRAAYLSQHPSDVDIVTYFIDEIGFSLVGNLSHTPSTTRTPAYLFVPPLQFECVNGLHCIHYPLPKSPFYWTSDPKGRHVIPKNDWVRYEIPELDVKTWFGSYWDDGEYEAVKQHLVRKKYGSNRKQYAVDHGYPELIYGVYQLLLPGSDSTDTTLGNPHEGRMEELRDSDEEVGDSDEELSDSDGEPEDSKEDKHFYSGTHLTSPSTFSLINAPSDLECTREEGLSITTRLANGLGRWKNTSGTSIPGHRTCIF